MLERSHVGKIRAACFERATFRAVFKLWHVGSFDYVEQ